MISFELKTLRNEAGFSQVKLANESGVSLPTIQNIEAKKANPSIDVITKLIAVLGVEIRITPAPFDAEIANQLGLPLVTNKKIKLAKGFDFKKMLKLESRKWQQQLKNNILNERERHAITAYLMAIKDHYPSFYKKELGTDYFDQLIEQERRNGKIIKLRRIALAYVAEYL